MVTPTVCWEWWGVLAMPTTEQPISILQFTGLKVSLRYSVAVHFWSLVLIHSVIISDIKASRPKFWPWALTSWPRPRAFGLDLASVKLTWPRNTWYPMQNNIGCIHFVVVIIATFITKTWLSTPMWYTHSFVCSWHCCHVFLFRSIYMWPAWTLASASKTWPRPCGSGRNLGLSLRVLASALVLTFGLI